jgi:serine/threonine protein kinase/WD40 repeat protein
MNTTRPHASAASLPLTVARQIDDVCGEFEAAWQADTRPDLAAFADRVTGPARTPLLHQLIRLDAYYRRQAGETPAADEYAARFPDLDAVALRSATDETVPDGKSAAPFPPDAVFAGHQLLGELGRGGMGVVYRARHLGLNRVVALKMIRSAGLASPAELSRFRTEAEAVARLQHPNIVHIFEVGECLPPGSAVAVPYLSLEFVAGGPLAGRFDRTPQPPRFAAEVVEAVARAVHHAHEQGIVHRDLKPANVLLAAAPGEPAASAAWVPKVTDFGLAKRLDADDQTHTGAILGTPAYMAPEQAAGDTRRVGPAADVYALGGILYEALTGNPPFRGENAASTLEMVRTQEPLPPRRLLPTVPRDLEVIALKCLAKDPAKRYPSAAELADDLRRYLDGRPITARPTPAWERGLKFVRRRPWPSGLVATAVVSLCAVIGILSVKNAEVRTALTGEQQARGEVDQKNTELAKSVTALQAANERVGTEKTRAEDALKERTAALADKTSALKKQEWEAYLRTVPLAYREWSEGNAARYESLLSSCPEHLRGWEWQFLKRLGGYAQDARFPQPVVPTGVALDAGRKLIAFVSEKGLLVEAKTRGRLSGGTKVYEAAADQVSGTVAGIDPGGQWVVAPKGGEVRVVFLGNKTVTTLGTHAADPTGKPTRVTAVAVHPDGRTVATSGSDNTVRIWDVRGVRPPVELPGRNGTAVANRTLGPYIAFSPDKRHLAIGDFEKGNGDVILPRLTIVDAETGKVVHTHPLRTSPPITALAYLPDSSGILVGFAGVGPPSPRAQVFNPTDGKVVLSLPVLYEHVTAVAVDPFSRSTLATAHSEGVIRLWDATTGQPTYSFPTRTGLPKPFDTFGRGPEHGELAFEDPGRLIAAEPYWVRSWPAMVPPMMAALRPPDGPPPPANRNAGKWDPEDAQTVLSLSSTSPFSTRTGKPAASVRRASATEVEVLDPSRNVIGRLSGVKTASTLFLVSPDAKHLVMWSSQEKVFKVWPIPGTPTAPPAPRLDLSGTYPHVSFAFSGDGRRLAVAGDERGTVYDTERFEPLSTFGLAPKMPSLLFDPSGDRLLGFSNVAPVALWDVKTGAEVWRSTDRGFSPSLAKFSPDGRLVVVASLSSELRAYDAASGNRLWTRPGTFERFDRIEFIAGGERLVAKVGGGDEVKVLDTRTGDETLSFRFGSREGMLARNKPIAR